MTKRSTQSLLALALLAGAASFMPRPAQAQDAQEARERQVANMHTLCNRGDRRACVRFGMFIQQNQDHMAVWRQTHPEYFWWER